MTQNCSQNCGIDAIAKEVKHHNNCRKLYLAAAKRKCEESLTKRCDVHEKAFSVVKKHDDKVIGDGGGNMLTKLLQKFKCFLKMALQIPTIQYMPVVTTENRQGARRQSEDRKDYQKVRPCCIRNYRRCP